MRLCWLENLYIYQHSILSRSRLLHNLQRKLRCSLKHISNISFLLQLLVITNKQ